ncbi:hypothetical protein AB0D99_09460 [Streptomyces sp. NPDC047971]|uniref:hypothetical protein n=1 Tax=Streptomyces sp. NPDC047971 TaxID=3154499 RepID=UPI0033C05CCB
MAHDDATAVTMGSLFDPDPERWGLRGDPHVWWALRDRLSGTEMPASLDETVDILRVTFDDLVGVDLVGDPASSVYRKPFAHGGMSSGMVSLDTWRESLMPLLASRARTLMTPS